MPKVNILDLLQNTIDEVKQGNRNNPNEPTADPTVFDFLKGKLSDIHQVNQERKARGERPLKLKDLLKGKLKEARNQHKDNPNVPDSIFDRLRDKIDEQDRNRQQQRSEESIAEIINEYGIDVSRLSRNELNQIQQRYVADNDKLDEQYAQYIHQLNQSR